MRRAAVLVALAACGSSEKSEPRPGDALMTPALEQELLAAWQGTWELPFTVDDGTTEVWTVDGTTLTRWNGKEKVDRTLRLLARCLAKVSWSKGGGETFMYQAFAFADGRLIVDSMIGTVDGTSFTACHDLGFVYTSDEHGCRFWQKPIVSRKGQGLVPHPATCTVTGTTYTLSSPDDVTGEHTLVADGALLRKDLAPSEPATRQP